MANVVLVVDMLVGFLEEGHPLYCGSQAREIIPRVRQILEREQAKGSPILYLVDSHEPDDKEFAMFPPHCLAGSSESSLIQELKDFPGEIIYKTRYSGFYETELDKRLQELHPDKVIVLGVCTDICVMHTVADLRNRDYAVEVPVEAVASFDQAAHDFALQHMDKVLGAKIV